MGKTYPIRNVGGGVVKQTSEKKKTSVGLFFTFRHPLDWNWPTEFVCTCLIIMTFGY